jgi:hypothetical protein
LFKWEVCPVHTFLGVEIVWVEEIIEDFGFPTGIVCVWVGDMVVARLRAVRNTDHSLVGRVMVLVVVHEACHLIEVSILVEYRALERQLRLRLLEVWSRLICETPRKVS